MRIVLVHRYFVPDTPPYAHILRHIAIQLADDGHSVTVLTCQPSYNRSAAGGRAPKTERIAPGVTVRRFAVLPDRRSSILKAINLAWFCLRLMAEQRRHGTVDVIMAASTPPIAIAKISSWIARRRGARFVYHKQDIYPEVVTAPGILRAGRWSRLLRAMDARTDRAADRVVVLSEDMADTVRARRVKPDRIVVINNFDPWQLPDDRPAPDALPPTGERLTVVLAGNLGRFQNLDTVFAAMAQAASECIEYHFFGTGALAARLCALVDERQLARVELHGYRPPAEVAEFLRARADIGIVSLAPGVIRAAYPSRTMAYLRQGCPVLALVEPGTALADQLESYDAGVQVDPGSPDELAAELRAAADRPRDWRDRRDRAQRLYREQFDAEVLLPRWSRLLAELAVRSGPA